MQLTKTLVPDRGEPTMKTGYLLMALRNPETRRKQFFFEKKNQKT
jgi:hypothetical protein